MADDRIVVVVGPAPGGWCVQADPCQPLMFRSGHEAEAHARRLAGRLCDLGLDTWLEVRDRRGRLAGSVRYVPSVAERCGERRSETSAADLSSSAIDIVTR